MDEHRAGVQLDPSQYRILIAEDNPGDVRLLQEVLKDHNLQCHVTVVTDGEKALALFDGSAPAPDIHLMLLDLNLPKTSGKEILNFIRRKPQYRALPIIVLSTSISPLDAAEVEKLGASRFIMKPSNLDEFFCIGTVIKDLLPR